MHPGRGPDVTSTEQAESTAQYYARRAAEYDRIYAKPERQDDLVALRARVRDAFAGLRVLDLACGTGYWTVPLAERAREVVGVDINAEVLAIARARLLAIDPADGRCPVSFRQADLYDMPRPDSGPPDGPVPDRNTPDHQAGSPNCALARFDGALVAHWWSHVALDETDRFLDALHARLDAGARVMLLDNRLVPGSSTPVARTDGAGNTYQLRRLDDGSTFEVLKNFPDAASIERALAGRATDIEFTPFDYYWTATYRVVPAP